MEDIKEMNDNDLKIDETTEPMMLNITGNIDLVGKYVDLTGNLTGNLTGKKEIENISYEMKEYEPNYKYIYEVQLLKNKRCFKPIYTMYYLFEKHTRYAHERLANETGKIVVIRVRSDDEKYLIAIRNSYMEDKGKEPNEDFEAFHKYHTELSL
jgi:hypothetical protein